jgi:hypothetical protein
LATGDFDGDGRQDLFLATGAAWYYAPAGLAEWRYLKADRAERGDLLFGDVDGDGRTDVVIKQGSIWLVSWAGASERERINERDGPSAISRLETSMGMDVPTCSTRMAASG